jgi:hypothetical protein
MVLIIIIIIRSLFVGYRRSLAWDKALFCILSRALQVGQLHAIDMEIYHETVQLEESIQAI